MSAHALIIEALRQSNTASNAIIQLAVELDILANQLPVAAPYSQQFRDIARKIRIEAKKIG